MSASASSASNPVTVDITPGQTPSAPPAMKSIAFNPATQLLVFTLTDGSQITVSGFAAAIAQSLGGNSLAVLDDDGALLLGGKPRLGVSAAGNLTMPTPLPDTSDGYTVVGGSTEIYLNGSGPMEVA